MTTELLKILSVLGFSATKFMWGIGLVFAYSYGFMHSVLLTVGGGMIGVIFFTNFSDWVFRLFSRDKNLLKGIKINKRRRWLVWFRSRYGLAGISFLTPVLFSVPIGAFLATSLEKNKQVIILHMFLAFLFWSIFFSAAFYFLGLKVDDVIAWFIFW